MLEKDIGQTVRWSNDRRLQISCYLNTFRFRGVDTFNSAWPDIGGKASVRLSLLVWLSTHYYFPTELTSHRYVQRNFLSRKWNHNLFLWQRFKLCKNEKLSSWEACWLPSGSLMGEGWVSTSTSGNTCGIRELKQGRRNGSDDGRKQWLVEWGKIIDVHVRHAL